MQFVLAGLATTNTLQVGFARFNASPYPLKIPPLIFKRSLRSIPALRGKPPKKIPRSKSLKRTLGSAEYSTELTRGYAQSIISISIALSTFYIGSISKSLRLIRTFGPKTLPKHN